MTVLLDDPFSALTNWVETDTESKLTVSGGRVVVDGGKASPAYNDPGLRHPTSGTLTRSTLGAFSVLVRTTNRGGNGPAVALSATTNPATPPGVIFEYPVWKAFGVEVTKPGTRVGSKDFLLTLVPRSGGGFLAFASAAPGGNDPVYPAFPDGVLLWATDSENDASLYALLSNHSGYWSADYAKVLDTAELPAALTTRSGVAAGADDFGSGTTLTGRSTPVGARAWSVTGGTASISGGLASVPDAVRAFFDCGARPHVIDCYMTRTGSGSAVLYFRSAGTAATSWKVKIKSDRITLEDTSTTVDQTGAFIATAGTQYRIRVKDWGDRVEVYVDGAATPVVHGATPATNNQLSNTQVGIGSDDGTTSTFSEIIAYPEAIALPAALGPVPEVPAPQGSAATITFDAPDGTGVTDYNGAFVERSGTWLITGGRAGMDAVGNGLITLHTGAAGSDHAIAADILTPASTPGGYPPDWYPGIVVRWTDDDHYIHARFLYQNNSPEIEIWEQNGAGNPREIIGYWNMGAGSLLPGTIYRLTLAAKGDQVAAYLGTECKVQATTSILTGDAAGVGVLEDGPKSGQPQWDNVAIYATSEGVDAAPPTISLVAVSGIDTTEAVVSWVTDELSDSQVQYGTTTSYGQSSALNPADTSLHSVPLFALAPGTLYHFRVLSRDAAGNLAFSGDYEFTTQVLPGAPGPFAQRMQRWDNRTIYARSNVYATFMETAGTELDDLHASVYDTLGQFFVDTATWGLPRWEAEMGLVPRPEATMQERREAIRARLRGLGTATIKLIKSVGQSYLGGQLDVTEDYKAYRLIISFVDIRGVPLNLADVQAALRAIVPAHLTIDFFFRYSTWDSVDAADLTWDEVDALGLTWDQWDVNF